MRSTTDTPAPDTITQELGQKLSGKLDEAGVLHLKRSSFIAGADLFRSCGVAKPVNSVSTNSGTMLKLRTIRPFSEIFVFVHGEPVNDETIDLMWSGNA